MFFCGIYRALLLGLLSQDQVDSCDPALMFTIPRLAIVAGLLIFPDGPLCLDRGELSDMFRPFRSLLIKIRELLWTLSKSELSALERSLCSVDEPFSETCELEETSNEQESDESAIVHQNNKNSTSTTVSVCGSSAGRNQHNTTSSSQNQPQHPHFHHYHHLHHHHHHGGSQELSENEIEVPLAQSIQDYLDQLYKGFPQCKDFISELCQSAVSANASNISSQGTSTTVPDGAASTSDNNHSVMYSQSLGESISCPSKLLTIIFCMLNAGIQHNFYNNNGIYINVYYLQQPIPSPPLMLKVTPTLT